MFARAKALCEWDYAGITLAVAEVVAVIEKRKDVLENWRSWR